MKAAYSLVFSLLLCLVAGCATVSSTPSAASLTLPETKKIVVSVCYFKRPNIIFSKAEPASGSDFSEFIRKETVTFVVVLGKKLSSEGFSDVSLDFLSPGGCEVKDDAAGGVAVAVIFVMAHQGFGFSEDLIIADVFIKMPGIDRMIGVDRKMVNGITSNIKAEVAAEEVTTALLVKIKDAQRKKKPDSGGG